MMGIDYKLIAAAKEANEVLTRLVGAISLDGEERTRAAGMLLATIAEQMGAVIVLMATPMQSHAPILVRTMLEALVDLKCVVTDEDYLEQLEFTDVLQLRKVLIDYAKDPEFMAVEQFQREHAAVMAEVEPRYEELRQGRSPVDIATRFRRAGMAGAYVVYRMYCTWSHNQLFALRGRHQASGPIEMGAAMPIDMQRAVIVNAVKTYSDALRMLPQFASNADAGKIEVALMTADALVSSALPAGYGGGDAMPEGVAQTDSR